MTWSFDYTPNMVLQILHFPYPTPPDRDALRSAENSLVAISALTPKNALLSQQTSTGADLKLTAVGEEMIGYPLPPRHSRLILAAAELLQQGRFKDKKLLVYAIGLAAAMSMEAPFLASASPTTGSQTQYTDANTVKVLSPCVFQYCECVLFASKVMKVVHASL